MEKRCSNCDENFSCYPKDCWCSQVRLDKSQLMWIRQHFQDCLCPDCLTNLSLKDTNQ